MEEKYQEALALYNQCDYEGAYAIIIDNGLCSTEKGDFLCNECRKQILQQYIYLIKDYVEQGLYVEAKELRQQYYSKYDFNSILSEIDIPEPISIISTKNDERQIPIKDGELINKKQKSFITLLLFPLLAVIIIAACFFLNLKVDDKTKVEELLATINGNPQSEVLYTTLSQDVEKHFIIYRTDNNIYWSSSDSLKLILSPDELVYATFYSAEFKDNDMSLDISLSKEHESMSSIMKRVLWDKQGRNWSIKCLNENCLLIEKRILFFIDNPKYLYIGDEFKYQDNKGNVCISVSGPFYTYPYHYYDFPLLHSIYSEGGYFVRSGKSFSIDIIIDKRGNCVSHSEFIEMCRMLLPVPDGTNMHEIVSKYLPMLDRKIYEEEGL